MFKVGDRVMNVNEYASHEGEEVTVIEVQETYPGSYLVEYDNHINRHSGEGFSDVIGEYGRCWWEKDDTIEKIKKGDNMKMLETICEELGVEIGEEWYGNDGKTHMIENGKILEYYKPESYNGIDYEGWVVSEDKVYADILKGKLKPMWRPEDGEFYYLVDLATPRLYSHTYWCNSFIDDWRLRKGWVFKTSEEAVVAANKMLRVLED